MGNKYIETVGKDKPDEVDPQESLHKIVTSEGETNDYSKEVPHLRESVLDHISEFQMELETRWVTQIIWIGMSINDLVKLYKNKNPLKTLWIELGPCTGLVCSFALPSPNGHILCLVNAPRLCALSLSYVHSNAPIYTIYGALELILRLCAGDNGTI